MERCWFTLENCRDNGGTLELQVLAGCDGDGQIGLRGVGRKRGKSSVEASDGSVAKASSVCWKPSDNPQKRDCSTAAQAGWRARG
ncbi:hypothetical protein NL676_038828 [Syzygium grande]|nr:hypothetical protein NL676_038828 [Syzygium grande]